MESFPKAKKGRWKNVMNNFLKLLYKEMTDVNNGKVEKEFKFLFTVVLLVFIQITFSESLSCPYRTFRGKFRKYQNCPHSAATDESISCVHNPRSPNNCTATVSDSHSMRSKSDKTVCDFDLYRCQRHLMSVASTFICSSLHERVTANFDVFFALCLRNF